MTTNGSTKEEEGLEWRKKSLWDYLRQHILALQREIQESGLMKGQVRSLSVDGSMIKRGCRYPLSRRSGKENSNTS